MLDFLIVTIVLSFFGFVFYEMHMYSGGLMHKNGDIRKYVKTYIHDGKVIKKEEVLQQYVKEYGYGYWSDLETTDRVIEVKDIEYFKDCEKKGYSYV